MTLAEPMDASEVALRRDESGDRTETRTRSGVIDALRALAALMVLVDHTIDFGAVSGSLATATSKMLAAGVFLFFIISGYLIAGPFLRALVRGDPLPKLPPYLVRRGARIYPAYWIALAAVFLLIPPAHGVRTYQIPVHVLLLQSSWPHAGEPEAIFGPAWTLGVEIAFYVFVPLAAMLLRALHPAPWRPGKLALAVLAAAIASVTWLYFVNVHFGTSSSQLSLFANIGLQVWLFAFCPGMLIALAALAAEGRQPWVGYQKLMTRPALCISLAAILWPAAYALGQSGSAWLFTASTPIYTVAGGLVVGCSVVAGSWISRPVRLLAPIGLISYGIYLWHFIVIDYLWTHTSIGRHGPLGWPAEVALVMAITLPLAAVSWFAIERPFIHGAADWASRYRRRQVGPVQYRRA